MINIRKSEDRGFADHGWLQSRHTFSFASYMDPEHMKFRALRVINEDWIQDGKGFDTLPHENMEIVTYPISGALEHKDSMGNGSVIRPGELQRMTAGTGITHSEFNHLKDETTHMLQIWIYPERGGLPPGYEQRSFSGRMKPDRLTLLASQTGRDKSLTIHQDVEIHGCRLSKDASLEYTIDTDRYVWIQVIEGTLDINGTVLHAGDGAGIDNESTLTIAAKEASEFLLFDLA